MFRRTALAAAAFVAAGALVLTACGSNPEPAPTKAAEANPDASVAIRLVLEPGNLDIRETAGANKMINIFRGICWVGALIPILGIFIVILSFVIGLFGSMYLILKQNVGGGIKQLIFTFIGGFVALGVWFVVNIAVIGLFG